MSHRHRAGLRQQIAAEAARILADQDYLDFAEARRRAAHRLNCGDRHSMPSNSEIHQALREYQQIFQRQRQPTRLQRLRELALQAMKSLERFRPRLAGEVLSGTTGANSGIELHLYADNPEEVALHLMEKKIPFQDDEIMVNFSRGKKAPRPLFSFQAGETRIGLLILKPNDLANPPIDPITERPLNGAPIKRVEALLSEMDAG